LFSDSQKGADTSAILYSMIETAKANHIEQLSIPEKGIYNAATSGDARSH
jgi:hypothetical protein